MQDLTHGLAEAREGDVTPAFDASPFDGLETKAARPGAAPAAPAADPVADAVKAIGQAVLQLNGKIDALATKAATTRVPAAPAGPQDQPRVGAWQRLKDEINAADRARKAGRYDPLVEVTIERREKELAEAEDRARKAEAELRQAKTRLARPAGLPGRPAASPANEKAAALARYRKGVVAWLRTGNEYAMGEHIKTLEAKTLTQGANADGGYMLMPERDTGPIERVVTQLNPMRDIVTVRSISSATFVKPINKGGATAGFVGETAARPETTTPTLAQIEISALELYAMPAASSQLLDDAMIDMEAWLADEVGIAFAEQEAGAVVVGGDSGRFQGLLSPTKVANASWTWGNIGYLATGASGDLHATLPADVFHDVPMSLKQAYRQNGRWVLNRSSIAKVRKIKDSTGQFLWQQNLQAGEPSSLNGYPIVEVEQMPDFAANAYPIAFGDFKRAYTLVDRLGVRVLRDPYSSKPYVLFYTTKRVGGGYVNFEAVKLIKASAS